MNDTDKDEYSKFLRNILAMVIPNKRIPDSAKIDKIYDLVIETGDECVHHGINWTKDIDAMMNSYLCDCNENPDNI